MIRSLIPGFLILSTFACTSYELRSPDQRNPVVLAVNADPAKCEVVHTDGMYALLFGAVPLTSLEKYQSFPPAADGSSRTYVVSKKATWVDFLVNIFGGWAVTLTRSTIEVQACKEQVAIQSQEAREEELRKTLAKYANRSGDPMVLTTSGEAFQGRIVEYDESGITIETVQVRKLDPPKKMDVVYMKSGETIRGRVTNQSTDAITVRTESGSTRRLRKSSMARLSLDVLVDEEEIPTKKTIARSDIRKVILLKDAPRPTPEESQSNEESKQPESEKSEESSGGESSEKAPVKKESEDTKAPEESKDAAKDSEAEKKPADN